jgi:cytochrome b subunit of formate dehydrogenase
MNQYFVRFSLKQRIEHILTMVTFVGLCVTGLPQKFYASAPSAASTPPAGSTASSG